MSDSLDDKLKGLQLAFLPGVPVSLTPEMIEQIKQAFTDAGYKPPTPADEGDAVIISQTDIDRNNMMTGEQWYERFKEMLPLQPYDSGIYTPEGYIWEGAILAAARRAAGLDKSN